MYSESWLLSKSSFLQRIASHSLASTSKTSRNVSCSYYFAFDSTARESGQAVSPYVDKQTEDPAQLDRWASTENWEGSRRNDSVDTKNGQAEAPKNLKINRDLLLYKARQKSQQSFRITNYSRQLEAMQEAEQALNKCISLDPTDPRAYVTLGKLMQRQRRFKEAGQVYQDAIAVTGGKNAHVWQAWATLEGRAGNHAAARKYLKAAVLVDPQHAASWHAWGMLEKRTGNLAAAKDIWIKGIKKCGSPPNPHLYQSLAVLAGDMGFVDEARAWFRKGTESIRGCKSHALWHAWAILEERQGEPKTVRYLYSKGLEVSPQSRYIHLAWALFEKNQGKIENARKLLERGRELNPKDAAIVQAWAILENEAGNIDQARELFRSASELDPRMNHVWQAWGLLEMKAGRFSQARHLFQSGIWSSDESTQTCHVWQAWATLEYRAGNIALARTMYTCAVKAQPSSVKAWESWLLMENALGETRRALMLELAMKRGFNPATLPKKFATPENISMEGEVSMIESVVKTVNEWMRKLDRKRRLAQRAPPSYLNCPVPDDTPEEVVEKIPAVEEMMNYHDKKMKLPKASLNTL